MATEPSALQIDHFSLQNERRPIGISWKIKYPVSSRAAPRFVKMPGNLSEGWREKEKKADGQTGWISSSSQSSHSSTYISFCLFSVSASLIYYIGLCRYIVENLLHSRHCRLSGIRENVPFSHWRVFMRRLQPRSVHSEDPIPGCLSSFTISQQDPESSVLCSFYPSASPIPAHTWCWCWRGLDALPSLYPIRSLVTHNRPSGKRPIPSRIESSSLPLRFFFIIPPPTPYI